MIQVIYSVRILNYSRMNPLSSNISGKCKQINNTGNKLKLFLNSFYYTEMEIRDHYLEMFAFKLSAEIEILKSNFRTSFQVG